MSENKLYQVRRYAHSGHPDVAAQYSLGWFADDEPMTREQFNALVDEAITQAADTSFRLNAERRKPSLLARREAPAFGQWSVDDEGDDLLVFSTLRYTCALDEHDDESCECYEECEGFEASPILIQSNETTETKGV